MNLRAIKRGLAGLYYYLVGHLILLFHYKRKYCKGRHFSGKLNGLCSVGWQWVVRDYWSCRRMYANRNALWPVSPHTRVLHPQNIFFHPDDLNNFQGMGVYFQAIGRITIGRGTYIASNVGLITSNHTIGDLDLHDEPKPITLGEHCWIGMNSVILPGVTLGDHTVVGAGAVVTRSFPEGHCVLVGNPAHMMKRTGENK